MKHTPNLIDTLALVPTASTNLYAFRLLLLKVILICGSGAVALMWFFEAQANKVTPFDRVAYPVIILLFSICCICLFTRPSTLAWIERLSFAAFALFMVLTAQPALQMGKQAYEIASLAQWIPLVYTAAFFFLDTRRSILVSGFVYLAVLLPYFVELSLYEPIWWVPERGLLVLNMFCSHPVYIVTLSGIARLKTHVLEARAHANILRIAASVDYLTGVANRRTITNAIENALDQAHKRREAVFVILFDIDHFKRINDTFGHGIGDNVLIQVCGILKQHLRASDELGRWGGEEFLIVANAANPTEAARLAERLRALVAGHRFEPVVQLTASFGVAVSLPHDTTAMFVKRADQALYQAKLHGRNCVEVAPADSDIGAGIALIPPSR